MEAFVFGIDSTIIFNLFIHLRALTKEPVVNLFTNYPQQMDNVLTTALKRSFFITLIYVGSGTVSVLCLGLHSQHYEIIDDLLTIILFLTIPVTCISFAIMYSSPDYGAVLLVQSVVFVLFWFILFLILKKMIKKKRQKDITV